MVWSLLLSGMRLYVWWCGKMAELKPCPVCGGIPGTMRVGDQRQYRVFRCPLCGYIAAELHEARLTIWGAKRVWNRRVGDGK